MTIFDLYKMNKSYYLNFRVFLLLIFCYSTFHTDLAPLKNIPSLPSNQFQDPITLTSSHLSEPIPLSWVNWWLGPNFTSTQSLFGQESKSPPTGRNVSFNSCAIFAEAFQTPPLPVNSVSYPLDGCGVLHVPHADNYSNEVHLRACIV